MGNASRVLASATTELVDDLSGGYRAGQLFIGTALRQTPPTDDCVYLGHEADTWYDQNCRIVFTLSKGLVSVGLPRSARKSDLKYGTHYRIEWHGDGSVPLEVLLPCTLSCAELPQQDALGWDDIKHLPQGFVVIRTSPDETLPDAQGNNTVVPRETRYHAPFVKPDRERDYRLVWEVLA